MKLIQIIKKRRSVRSYKPDQVPENMVQQVMEAARWAPSWANTQCWEFILVRDSSIKKKLAATLPPPNPAKSAITQAPIIIAACALLEKSGYIRGKITTDKGDWFMFDLGLSTQNLALTAHSLGLGTVHVGLFDAPKAAEILGLPDGMAVVELIPLGFPAELPEETPRKDLKEMIHYDKYGQKESI